MNPSIRKIFSSGVRNLLCIFFTAVLFLSSCSGKNPSSDIESKNDWVEEEIKKSSSEKIPEQVIEKQKTNPEIEKLGRVLSSMSERAKNAIPNGNPEEFLADLHKVLDAEKYFSQEDLSLYYLIDKKHNVGADYVPKNLVPLKKNDLYKLNRNDLSLRPDVYDALEIIAQAAYADGVPLTVSSTYRSYDYQKKLFQHWVDVDGLEEAERESARPGTSQHQLGSAIDFGLIDDSFIDTKMGKWLNENAMTYGWSLSFPKEYEDVTGYRWECWHFRYIGVEACRFQKKWFSNVQQFMIEFIDEWKKN